MAGKSLRLILLLAILSGIVYAYQTPLETVFLRLERTYFPCAQPIAYSIGSFDEHFGITKENFLSAVKDAEAIWETPTKRDLFAYDPTGALAINLIYDYRQEATETLKKLGLVLENSSTAYHALKTRYNSLVALYEQKKTAFDVEVTTYQNRLEAYNREVARWNKRGGAPKSEFERLNAEKLWLADEVARIKEAEREVNELANNLNAVVAGLNQIAANLNLTVDHYNTVGSARGEEFEEGIYRSDASGIAIDIYEFDSRQKLVQVLAHELGHAVGLPHVEDTHAVMYRLNSGYLEKLSPSDIEAVQAKCVGSASPKP